MGSKGGLTSLPSAILCNLTVGSLYKLVVLPLADQGSLHECYKYTSLVSLLLKHEGCICINTVQFQYITKKCFYNMIWFYKPEIMSYLGFPTNDACNKLDSTFRSSKRETEKSVCCQFWCSVYTAWCLCTKSSFIVVYPADGDTAISETLTPHYLLTTFLCIWSFNIMYQYELIFTFYMHQVRKINT